MQNKLVQHPDLKHLFIRCDGVVFKRCDKSGTLKELKQTKRPDGYFVVCTGRLVKANGKPTIQQRRVHRLVLEAFFGKCPPGHTARHLDSDPNNNNINNLKWGTDLEQHADKLSRGTQVDPIPQKGSDNHFYRGIADSPEMNKALELIKSGVSHRRAAELTGMSKTHVTRMNKRRNGP